jgi:predicted nucleotidyltransferase
MSDTGDPLLPPASGRFVLRINPALHAALRAAAAAAHLSLNAYCSRVLAAPGVSVTEPANTIVSRALELFGAALVGLVAYGSWSRDEQVAGSDLDVLIVLEPIVPITRELYRIWDEAPPVHWDGHRVEPHYVHPVRPGQQVTGTWAEAAVDGIVLYERGFEVSKRLVSLRGRIADGAVTRHRAHGQPYWVGAA